jgi:predicted ester cyclase
VDWGLFDRLHAADFEDCSAVDRATDRRAFAAALADLVRAFPDLRTEIDDLVVDETTGKVAVRWSGTGTNRAAFMGRGPTGMATPMTGIEIIEIEAGAIARRWGEWDISAHAGEGKSIS